MIVSRVSDIEDVWAEKIKTVWNKTVGGIFETGRLLIEAKKALPHGGFEIMVRDQLPFGARTAQMFMSIAQSPVLANPNNGAFLPPYWRTLYDLSRLEPEELEAGFRRRLIKPELQRKDLPTIVKKIRRAMGKRVVWRRRSEPSRPRPTALDGLRKAWGRATEQQRAMFLKEVTTGASLSTNPSDRTQAEPIVGALA